MDTYMMALVITSIVGWGLWGFFAKVGVVAVGKNQCMLVAYLTMTLIVVCYLFMTWSTSFSINRYIVFSVLTGITGAMGAIAFWTALEKLPIAILRPAASLSVVVTVILGIVILKEKLEISHMLGILFALVATFLLSR